MDNANENVNTVIQTVGSSLTPESESTNSFLSLFKKPLFWVFIIIFLAFLGINIFSYLSAGTQDITNILQPLFNAITSIIQNLTGNLTEQVVDVTAEGAKEVVNATDTVIHDTATTVTSGLSDVQSVTKGQPSPSTPTTTNPGVPVQNTQTLQNVQQSSMSQNNALNSVLSTATPEQQLSNGETQDYQADDATSTIQSGSGKAGWCYIGLDRGFRTCAEVGVNDTCMSGEIFPSQDICINPNLRS